MDNFDKECPRCHGKGLPGQATQPLPPTPISAAQPLPPNRFTPPPIKSVEVPNGNNSWRLKGGLVFVVLLIVAVLGYRHWIHSPQYSLWQAQKAFATRNVVSFEQYVDIDNTVDHLVDDLFAESIAKQENELAQPSTNPFDEMGKELAKGFLAMLKPAISTAVKKGIRYYIAQGKIEDNAVGSNNDLPNLDLSKTVREHSAKFDGFDYVRKENTNAFVGLRMVKKESNEAPFIIELQMQWMGGYWQVKKWSNAQAVLRQLKITDDNIALPASSTTSPASSPVKSASDTNTSPAATVNVNEQIKAYRMFARKAVQDLDDIAQNLKSSYSSGMTAYAEAARTGRAKMQALAAELSSMTIPSDYAASSSIMSEGISDVETGLIHWIEYTKYQTASDQKEAMEKMENGNTLMVRAASMVE